MAKDGTYRDGRCVKAGSKPDALADKIMKGAPAKRMELPDFTEDMTDFDVDVIGDGMLGKHPTTGAAIASPLTQLLMNFQKQANLLWYEIYDIVKQNCTEPFEGSPQDSVMEQLLRSRRNM